MEYRDLYNENKIVTGKTYLKGSQIPEGFYKSIVISFIENNDGDILIQKRSKLKNGKWALTGGHPKAGESSIEGIITEIYEELGILIPKKEINLIKSIRKDNYFCDFYYIKQNIKIENLILQKEEVEEVKWLTKNEINKLIDNDLFHKKHTIVYNEIINILKKSQNL